MIAPAEHEPVICEKRGIVLIVYGMRAIGKKIKEARNGAELTQDQAAEKIMVSRQTISNWETGVSHS